MASMSSPPRPRKKGPQPLTALLESAVAPVLRQRGFATSAILKEWREIVGPRLAQWTTPLEVRWPRRKEEGAAPARNSRTQKAEAATLVLSCPGPFALEVQMAGAQILEAVNQRLGFGALGALVIKQAPRPAPPTKPERPQPDEASIAAMERTLADIEAPELRRALAELGAQVRLATLKA